MRCENDVAVAVYKKKKKNKNVLKTVLYQLYFDNSERRIFIWFSIALLAWLRVGEF